jgi:hypothetical protein
MKYLIRSIQIDASGNWYNGLQQGTRARILRAFDLWRYSPGPYINLSIQSK